MTIKACVVCGRPSAHGPRCELHQKTPMNRDRSYRKMRDKILAASSHCAICGQPFTDPNDPAVLDHRIPRAHGGTDDASNMQAAHRTCNGRKGATLPGGRGAGVPS